MQVQLRPEINSSRSRVILQPRSTGLPRDGAATHDPNTCPACDAARLQSDAARSQQLQPATRESLGLDLETAVEVTLIDQRPLKIPTTSEGPLLINRRLQGALLFGRSSSGVKGLFVLPGVTDADYNGIVRIMAQTSFLPIHIPKGSKIAQLVPVRVLTADLQTASERERSSQGFGSTGGLNT
uniref:dUTPase-like domain-containing protein n=1 Tax=Cairina moschata TaxID=8855 RepID=A0A8C3GKZ4_CAIMO